MNCEERPVDVIKLLSKADVSIADFYLAEKNRRLLEESRQKRDEDKERLLEQERLQREEAKKRLTAEVGSIMEDVSGVGRNYMTSLRVAVDRLTEVIHRAKEAGMLEEDLREAELQRRRLHNYEEVKGAIRVFCRVRPLIGRERPCSTPSDDVMSCTDGTNVTVGNRKFSFMSVFSPGTQDEIFEECKDLIQSVFDGYNATIFAYGQTGAGKTFTMYGTPDKQGIAPRTIRRIFDMVEVNKTRYEFTVTTSMMELYNNELSDLLARRRGLPNDKLCIKTGKVQVDNLTEEHCTDSQALVALMQGALSVRKVGETDMNMTSSRSHVILVVRIKSVNLETRETMQGKILLCDLAGSERLKKSGVSGEQKQEAIEVNKSLTALNRVIRSLANGDRHVPYKDHQLTQVLQDSIGGNAKTVMFVNCSPERSSLPETIQSLKYASWTADIRNTR